MLFNEKDFKGPFMVTYGDDEEQWEEEREESDLFTAISIAENAIENRGYGEVYDANANEVPLFAEWM